MFEAVSLNEMPIDFYSAVLHSIKDPFNILDRNFRILWVNKARADIHQRSLREMIGKFCYEMFQRRDKPCPECPVRVALDSGKPCVMERWVDLPDGIRRWGEVRAYPVLNKSGNVVYAIEIAIDITDKKRGIERQRGYVESMERTVEELTKKKIQALLEYEQEKRKMTLTEREIEVLSLIAKGFSNVRIAKILNISPHTVKSHVIHILNKLGVRDRTQAAVWATQHRLI